MIITEKLKQRLNVAHSRLLEVFRPCDTDPSMQYQMLHVIFFEDADQTASDEDHALEPAHNADPAGRCVGYPFPQKNGMGLT